MRVDLRSTSTTELERLERSLRVCLDQSVDAEQRAAEGRGSAQRKTHAVTCEVVVIGDRPAGELEQNARILQVVRAVDAHLGNVAQVQRASTDANIPLSLGREAVAIGLNEEVVARFEAHFFAEGFWDNNASSFVDGGFEGHDGILLWVMAHVNGIFRAS